MLLIPKSIFDQILAHLRRVYPEEGCGLISGTNGNATRFHPMTNTHHSPTTYFMDPKEQFAAFKAIRLASEDLLAIVHSHPHSEAYPSATDIRLAYYPDATYLILSLRDRNSPSLRGFRINDGAFSENSFQIVND